MCLGHVSAWAHVYVLGPMCVHACVWAQPVFRRVGSRTGLSGCPSWIHFVIARLHSFFDLLTLPLENLGVETVGSIPTEFGKRAIETFDSLACLEPMRRDAFGIHRILINFLVWCDVIEILGCKRAFTL